MPDNTETTLNTKSESNLLDGATGLETREQMSRDDFRQVVMQNSSVEAPTARRRLDLNNIQAASLKVLSPTQQEIETRKTDPQLALSNYAERLREDYKTNNDNFRDGLQILSDSLERGERITITCSCRGSGSSSSSSCHADVVKMAVEKVTAHVKSAAKDKGDESAKTENFGAREETPQKKQLSREQHVNPRTQRAINEIFSFSENDRVLANINETGGRNRSEQASHLGKSSQFIRDVYERGGSILDGYLIVPQEKLDDSPALTAATESYAVSRVTKILKDEGRARELAPTIVEYGNKIAGITADAETRLKVFGWIYDSLEGKSAPLAAYDQSEKPNFAETLDKIRVLAEEMHSLEPIDKTEFVPLSEIEKTHSVESVTEMHDETLDISEIYQEAISLETSEQSFESEIGEKIKSEGFERIDLMGNVPRIPADYSESEIVLLINQTLPEIDRQLENGIATKEILAPFNEAMRASASGDAQKRLEFTYQKQSLDQASSKQGQKDLEVMESIEQQLAKINLLRQNVIEFKKPSEYLQAEKAAVNTFYRRQMQETGHLLTKIDESLQTKSNEKTEETALKKELTKIREAHPNFAFKLENSSEIVVGIPSQDSVQTRNFVSSYINYQLDKPDTRLRFENERYRTYAARLESAVTRDDVMKISSEIRAENAALGLRWKDLSDNKKEKLSPRPLAAREMQFLFTEPSPIHYTGEMTAIRLSFAHSGTSRRLMTESLLKGEIAPSPEAQKLAKSLESRLERRDIRDSLLATRHFFESVKTPEDSLVHKNKFDHREIYQKLPPQEKDFIYRKAVRQKENLQYQLAFKKELLNAPAKINRLEHVKPESSQIEKAFQLHTLFHQAQILGQRTDTAPLTRTELKPRDASAILILLNNQPSEKLENLARVFQMSDDTGKKQIGEILQTFSRAEISKEENKTTISVKPPENGVVATRTYRELLEKFYPDNLQENNKYKFENFDDKEISRARENGQDEALKNFREEITSSNYRQDDSDRVVENEAVVLEKLERIAQFQIDGRGARRENEILTLKYAARAADKMHARKRDVPSLLDQQKIVSAALGVKAVSVGSNKVHNEFFQAVQKEITLTDFEKFTANHRLLGEMQSAIKQEFAGISANLNVLDENRLPAAKGAEKPERYQNISSAMPNQDRDDGKPVSLRIFEKELGKTEVQLLRQSLKEKFSDDIDLDKNFDLKTVFSNDERAAIKSAAIEAVKEKLEPKELDASNRKISPEASRQAFATYKQLERAVNLWQTGDDQPKIAEGFLKLDGEAVKLNQIRQDYHRSEKMALLSGGIKTDLVDFLRKNQALRPVNFESEINKILLSNLNRSDFVKLGEDSKKVSILSRQIAEKIEAKQIFSMKDKGHTIDSNLIHNTAKDFSDLKNDSSKTNHLEKSKDMHILTR